MTSMRRKDVASMSFRLHVTTRILINQCEIITFLILKSDIIENSRIELKGIVLPVPSNQIKVTVIMILPFSLVHLCFFLFHIIIEGKCGWINWGGGQRVCWPPLKLLGGPGPPSSYAYEDMLDKTYSWHRLCYAKPISGKGYAEQKLIILRDSVVKICKTGFFQVKNV